MKMPFSIKYGLNKIYWLFAWPLRHGYRFFVRPTRRGVKVVVVKDGKVVLVRPNYAHRKWTLPGGMVESSETYEDAARREVFEETGLRVGPPTFIRDYEVTENFVRSINKVFASTADTETLTVDGIEIKEATWFPLDALPSDRVPRVDENLAAFKRIQAIDTLQ